MAGQKTKWKKMPEEVRREAILNAARSLFAEQGYNQTSMNQVAAQAGLTKGGLYFHFENKEQLFEEVVRYLLDFERGELAEQIDTLAPIDRLRGFLNLWLEQLVSESGKPVSDWRIFFEAWDKPATRDYIIAFYSKARRYLVDVIRKGQRRKEIRATQPPEVLAVMAIALLDGLDLQTEIHRQDARQMVRGRRVIEAFLEGLQP
ncbi:MAG: TetR/AcrR family transcriptional regulator [Acidobacteria bacterium]|nr:TetR/AcrR family transcriptional regulator [Acidobacteriota bacterium]